MIPKDDATWIYLYRYDHVESLNLPIKNYLELQIDVDHFISGGVYKFSQHLGEMYELQQYDNQIVVFEVTGHGSGTQN